MGDVLICFVSFNHFSMMSTINGSEKVGGRMKKLAHGAASNLTLEKDLEFRS